MNTLSFYNYNVNLELHLYHNKQISYPMPLPKQDNRKSLFWQRLGQERHLLQNVASKNMCPRPRFSCHMT